MATPKLNLPTITGNETADVPRDFNAIANAIDNKAGAADGLATLGPDGKVPSNQVNVDLQPIEQALAAHTADEEQHLQVGERDSWDAKETPAGAQEKVERTSYSTIKSGKDAEGTYTNVEYRRKSDNTLAGRVVLSGGTAPQYTTRTITYYEIDGITVAKTEVFALSYDEDGELVSEV